MTAPDPVPNSEGHDNSSHHYLHIPAEEICFLCSQDCCVCYVDMMNSTEVVARISDAINIRRYYTIFLGSISTIARNFDAKIVKNAGDCLIFYFPETSDCANCSAFKNILECGIETMKAHLPINEKLMDGGLPPVDYRISADYGRVQVARSATSKAADLFGPTMNICAKINSKAGSHGMVIGGDLYQIIKSHSLDDYYNFGKVSDYSVGFKYAYPVYAVKGRRKDRKGPMSHPEVSAAASAAAGPRTAMTKAPPSNIMVIDNEPDILLTFQEFLASEGFNVDAFSDSHDALKRFAEVDASHYDLVVMDIRMPKLNGLQLYQRFKAMNAKIKIIFVSCLDAAEELVTVLPDVKSSDVIRKPIDHEHFIRTIKSYDAS
jgi:two-component system, OmpR family, response regulator ChvI